MNWFQTTRTIHHGVWEDPKRGKIVLCAYADGNWYAAYKLDGKVRSRHSCYDGGKASDMEGAKEAVLGFVKGLK